MTYAGLHQIDLPASAGEDGWQPYPQFQTATRSVSDMECHYSVLDPGCSPHPPHSHCEEELLIILDGSAEILIARDPDDRSPSIVPLSIGQFSYYEAWRHHTIRNVSDRPVTYLMFKWHNRTRRTALRRLLDFFSRKRPTLLSGTFDARPFTEDQATADFSAVRIFEGRTRWLKRLHCHLTRLKSGAGYAPHADDYDVAIVLLAGSIEIGGGTLRHRGIAYCGAGEMHGMHNPGPETAIYLVFEFRASGRDRKQRALALDQQGFTSSR